MALPRIYESVLRDQLGRHRQMALVAGPRQVGKTTTCRSLASSEGFLSWDNQNRDCFALECPSVVPVRTLLAQLL